MACSAGCLQFKSGYSVSGRRVVVTGLGIVSPVGLNLKESWDNILAGTSGVAPITEYDVDEYPVRFAATVKNFDASHVIPVKDQKKMDVFIHYGLVAAEEALQDSGLEITEENADRIGVSIGSGIGGLPMIETCHSKMLEGGPPMPEPIDTPIRSAFSSVISRPESCNASSAATRP